MRRLYARREIDAPAEAVWHALVSPDLWPHWGPSVRRARFDAPRLATGVTGSVTTVFGVELPFEITDYAESRRWAWKVAGVPATDHTVEPAGPHRCRVGFGVPWPAAAYLAVCHVALRRLDELTREPRSRVPVVTS